MTDIQGILSKVDKVVDLAELGDALEQFEVMKERWEQISSELQALQKPMTFEEWVRKVMEGIESPDVADILTRVGLGDVQATLAGWLDKIDSDTRETILLMLRPMDGEFPDGKDTVDLPLFSIDETITPSPDAPWSLTLKAESSLEAEASTSWPYDSDGVTDSFMSLRLSLDGSAEAKAKLPIQFGSISASAGTSQSFRLAYFYDYSDRSLPFVAATASSITQLVNPFSFDSVWNRLSSAQSEAFGATFDYDGNIEFGVGLSIATVFEGTALDIAPSLKLEASVKRPVTASLSLRRGRPTPDGYSVIMTMSRKKSTIRRFAASAGLKVDLSKSAERLHGVLSERLDEWEKGFEDIKEYLSPGTYIRKEFAAELNELIDDLVSDADIASAIKTDAAVALGLKANVKSEVTTWLEKLVTDKLDSFAGDYLSKKEEAIVNVADQILSDLPVVSILGEDQQAKIADTVKELLNRVLPRLRGKVRSIFNDVAGDAQKQIDLGNELKRIGAKTNDVVQQIDDLTKGVSEVIETYFERFRKLVDMLQDATKTTLTAELDIEDVLENGVNFEFSGEFTKRTPAARALYNALVAGGYKEVEQQVFNGLVVDGFILDRAKTKIGRFSRRERNWGFKVSFAGVTLSGREELKASVETVASADGKLCIDAEGLALRTLTKRKDKRIFEFLSDISLLHVKATADRDPQRLFEESLSFKMVYDEDHLERDEVAAFLSDLATTPYIPDGDAATSTFIDPQAQVLALDKVDKWIANPGGRAKLSGEMELRLLIGSDAIAKQLSQPRHADVDLFVLAMEQFERNGAYTENEWEEFLKVARRDLGSEAHDQLSGAPTSRDYRLLFGKRISKKHGTPRRGAPGRNRPKVQAPAHEHVRRLIEKAYAFASLLDAAQKIYNSPVGSNGEFDRRRVREWVTKKDKAVMKILSLGAGRSHAVWTFDNVLRFDDGVSGRALTFLQMLNHVFEAAEPRLVVVFKSTEGDKVVDQFVVA